MAPGVRLACRAGPEVAADTARRAVEVATSLAALNAERIELAPEPVYADVTWVSSYAIDPFTVSTADKIAVLGSTRGGCWPATVSTMSRRR